MPLSASEARAGFLPSIVYGRLLPEGSDRPTRRPSSTTPRSSRSQPGSDGMWLGSARSPASRGGQPKGGQRLQARRRSHRFRVNKCGFEELENLRVLAAQGGPTGLVDADC